MFCTAHLFINLLSSVLACGGVVQLRPGAGLCAPAACRAGREPQRQPQEHTLCRAPRTQLSKGARSDEL
eukprot:8016010-Pyramimonas_sp.AAC.2